MAHRERLSRLKTGKPPDIVSGGVDFHALVTVYFPCFVSYDLSPEMAPLSC